MRYKAIFKDKSQHSLFGEEYFADKRVFWVSHQSNLLGFSVDVCKKGRPIKIFDSTNQTEIIFNNDRDFDDWFTKNQSSDFDFGFSCLTNESEIIDELKKRINQILYFLKEELSILETSVLNPWRIDGGYKELEKKLVLAQNSIELIESKNSEISKSDTFRKTKKGFEVLKEIKIDNQDIIAFSKQTHEKLEQSKLIDLCKLNIKRITELNK
tara:strand:- start:121 stop:756 length:636 start_codon:yes stop_codon:yes gene_type:complete